MVYRPAGVYRAVAESPHLKKLAEKYKKDSSIVFLSVAVLYKLKNWKDALAVERSSWLQRFDKDGSIQNPYLADSFPKCILIDQQGKMVSFDAPSQAKVHNWKNC